MNSNVIPDLKKHSQGSFWVGIFLVVLGIAATLLPYISTLVAETWIALILVSAGVGKLVYAFRTREEDGFVWKVLLSILYITAGVMLFLSPRTGIITLTLLLGSFLLTEGVFELILAFQLRPQRNWNWVLVNGIVTLAVGAMIWAQWPFDAAWVIGLLMGVSILSTGVSRLMLSFNSSSSTPGSTDQAASV